MTKKLMGIWVSLSGMKTTVLKSSREPSGANRKSCMALQSLVHVRIIDSCYDFDSIQELERRPGRHGSAVGLAERGPTEEGRRKAQRNRTQGAEGDFAAQAGAE
jgi:hypothetical protein